MSKAKNKKRIILLSIDPLERNRRILNQLQTVTRLGWEAEVITVRSDADISPYIPKGVRVHRLPLFARSGPLMFLGFNAMLKIILLFRSFDILFVRGIWPFPAVLPVRLVKKFNIVYDAHEYFAGLPSLQNRPLLRKLWLWFEKHGVKKSALAFTVSEPILERLKQGYPFFTNWHLIRNLPPYRHPVSPKAETGKELTVVYHGYFMPERGLENLLQALARIDNPNIRLKLVGAGILKDNLLAMVKSLRLEKRVEFMGMQAQDPLYSILSSCDLGTVLLNPVSENHRFALPNKFFDYIMAGVPVLVSDIPSLTKYVKKYDIGMTVRPNDIGDIARALESIAGRKEELKQWRENCLTAAKELCWEKEEIKLRRAYEKTFL